MIRSDQLNPYSINRFPINAGPIQPVHFLKANTGIPMAAYRKTLIGTGMQLIPLAKL